jgi:hypothetical protein
MLSPLPSLLQQATTATKLTTTKTTTTKSMTTKTTTTKTTQDALKVALEVILEDNHKDIIMSTKNFSSTTTAKAMGTKKPCPATTIEGGGFITSPSNLRHGRTLVQRGWGGNDVTFPDMEAGNNDKVMVH